MTLKEWALHYAAKGIKVFPLSPGTKMPLKGSHGFKDATIDTEKINDWWNKHPNANIGIATGNGLTVIDLDVKNPPDDGKETAIEWQMNNGFFPSTARASTPSGGEHIFYWTSGAKYSSCTSDKFRKGIDIRSDGGYVVAAPSVLTKEKINGEYKWIDSNEIVEADHKVITFLMNKDTIGKHMVSTHEGNRNVTMRDQIWKMAQEYDKEETLDLAIRMNDEMCEPPLEQRTIEQMVDRAYKKLEKEKTAGVIDFEMIEPEDVEFLWYPYIPIGKITILAGEPGIGKTFLETELAAIISTGRPFPGDDLERDPGVVCILNTEDGLADTIVKRLRSAGANLKNVKAIDTSEKQLTFDDPRIENFLQRYHPKMMVFDPFQSFFGRGIDLNRSNETRPVFDKLLNLAQKYQCAIVLVMHLSKMTNASAINRILGSVDVVGAVRSALIVVNHPSVDGEKVMCHEKSNLAPKGESACYRIEKGAIDWTGFNELTADDCLSIQKKKKEMTKLQQVINLIQSRLDVCGRVKVKEVKDIAINEIGVSLATVSRAKEEMGLVDERDGFGGDVFWKKP